MLCSTQFKEAGPSQTTAQGTNDKAQYLKTKNSQCSVALSSQANICGLPVIAFCLKKETN